MSKCWPVVASSLALIHHCIHFFWGESSENDFFSDSSTSSELSTGFPLCSEHKHGWPWPVWKRPGRGRPTARLWGPFRLQRARRPLSRVCPAVANTDARGVPSSAPQGASAPSSSTNTTALLKTQGHAGRRSRPPAAPRACTRSGLRSAHVRHALRRLWRFRRRVLCPWARRPHSHPLICPTTQYPAELILNCLAGQRQTSLDLLETPTRPPGARGLPGAVLI